MRNEGVHPVDRRHSGNRDHRHRSPRDEPGKSVSEVQHDVLGVEVDLETGQGTPPERGKLGCRQSHEQPQVGDGDLAPPRRRPPRWLPLTHPGAHEPTSDLAIAQHQARDHCVQGRWGDETGQLQREVAGVDARCSALRLQRVACGRRPGHLLLRGCRLVTTVLAAADSTSPVANGVPPLGLFVVVPTSTVVVAATAAPAAGICGLAVLVASLGVAGAGRTAGLLGGSLCATSGPVAGLTPVQAQNARVVTATTDARARNPKAAVVAVMTALTESGLRVLSNPAVSGSTTQGAEGIGYDHDSVGLFQQRSTWGTAAQRMDPVTSTNLFLDAMLAAPSWPAAEPWRIAQDVQRSAFTGIPTAANHFSGVYGGNYRAFVVEAQRVVATARADGVKLDCGGTSAAVSPGPLEPTDSLPGSRSPGRRRARAPQWPSGSHSRSWASHTSGERAGRTATTAPASWPPHGVGRASRSWKDVHATARRRPHHDGSASPGNPLDARQRRIARGPRTRGDVHRTRASSWRPRGRGTSSRS